MDVVRVDPKDGRLFAAWHEARAAGAGAGRENPPLWALPELAVMFGTAGSTYLREAYVAVDDGHVVGSAELTAPLRDNPAYLDLDVCVPVPHRRRGVGTVLYERILRRAGELGRTTLGVEIHQPFDAPDVPGQAFAARHGFVHRQSEIRRLLHLPVAPSLLDDLWAEASRRAAGYEVRTWTDACPDEYAEQYAYLKSLLTTEAPMGDLEYDAEVWDVDRLREQERETKDQGRTLVTAVAVATDGSLAGHTQIGVPGHDPGVTYQWDTLVLPAHRGHRLGLALKVANLRALAERFPEARWMNTWNAAENAPMVAVNDALGFRPVERLEEWQRTP